MKRILVLQNQRIGDTLQTTPLLAGLREKHHPCHITLVANRMFADLKLGGLVDEVIHFDQNGLYRAFSDPDVSLVKKYDQARSFLEPFRNRPFDLAIDVPADTHMHLLASSLENAGELRGATLSAGRTWAYTHPEVMLLYTIGLCREVNRFNIVDLENLLAGVRPGEKRLHLPARPDADQFALQYLRNSGTEARKDYVVALQPGASEERKRWGESHFARLASLLVQRLGARVVLCGSLAEVPAAEKISRESGVSLISAVGRTDIAQLAALLRISDLLVTNDTGTMHIATAVGTPVIDISVGPVFFRETGPYAEGSLVIEADLDCSPCNFNALCRHYSCREGITPEMVFRLAKMFRDREDTDSLSRGEFRGTRLHRASFNDIGRLEFLPVFRDMISTYLFLGYFYSHTWEVFYGLRSPSKPALGILNEIEHLHDMESSWKNIREEVRQVIEDLLHLSQELNLGKRALRPVLLPGPAAASRQQWLRALNELDEVYRRLLLFGRMRPAVRYFTAYLELAVESLAGVDPGAAVQKIHETFRFILDQAEFLRQQVREASSRLDGNQQSFPAQRARS